MFSHIGWIEVSVRLTHVIWELSMFTSHDNAASLHEVCQIVLAVFSHVFIRSTLLVHIIVQTHHMPDGEKCERRATQQLQLYVKKKEKTRWTT